MNMSASYDSTAGEHAKGRSATRSFGEQSSRVAEEVQELGRVALANAGEVAGNLKEKGQNALEAGREKAKTAKSKFDDVVSEHPMKSVLIAVGVGVVLGYALQRRRS
jgi:ElaB/YqjD/DUF883 family membrane-anchored ribosome-binding protein